MRRQIRLGVIGTLGLVAVAAALGFRGQAMENRGPSWVGKAPKTAVLKASDGKSVDLAKVYGKQPVVVVIYRGVWCPFCQGQLRELAKHEADFKKAKTAVFFVSNEDAETQERMRKSVGASSYFRFLSDPEAKLGKEYGGVNAGGYLNAATFVVGKAGKITFGDANPDYHQRPTPEQILVSVRK
jgi:peroxiredoxin